VCRPRFVRASRPLDDASGASDAREGATNDER
jgi:hypothetical protein